MFFQHAIERLQSRRYLALIIVLIIATLLRAVRPGLYIIFWNETQLYDAGRAIARYGEWFWLGNRSSSSFFPAHSPFTYYINAIPYLFSLDPVMPRLLMALFGIVAVFILYWMTQRYFDKTTAFITALLFAVAPYPIQWSRFVWNPHYAQPFLALWMLTGLLGYYEGKRWAQIVHWLSLGFAAQSQIGYAFLAPVSVLLVLYHGRRVELWKPLIRSTLLAWAITLLTLLPWGIGLYQAGLSNTARGGIQFKLPDLVEVLRLFSLVTGSLGYSFNNLTHTMNFGEAELYSNPADWWFKPQLNIILWLQIALTLIAIAWLLTRGARQKLNRGTFPGFFIAIMAIWQLLSFVIQPASGIAVSDQYVMPIAFGAIPSLGILLGRLWRAKPLRRAAGAIAMTFVITQAWISISVLHWVDLNGDQETWFATIETHTEIAQRWFESDLPVLIVANTNTSPAYHDSELAHLWTIIKQDHPLDTVLLSEGGIPAQPQGQVVAIPAQSDQLSWLFADSQTIGRTADGEIMYRWEVMTPDDLPAPNIPHANMNQITFSNGVNLHGFYTEESPHSDETWSLLMLWELQAETADNKSYNFSVRLIDGESHRYGQVDGPLLDRGLWRNGVRVMNPIELNIPEDLPENRPLFLQILVYQYPDIVNQYVVDDAGNIIGDMIVLPLRNPQS